MHTVYLVLLMPAIFLITCAGGSAEAPPPTPAAESSCAQRDVQLTPVQGGYLVSCGAAVPEYLSAEGLARRVYKNRR